MDDIRRELKARRAGQNDIKHLLGDVRDRLPPPDTRLLPAPDTAEEG